MSYMRFLNTKYQIPSGQIKVLNSCLCRYYQSKYLENFSEEDKLKALTKINDSDKETLSRYTLTKQRLKSLIDWKDKNKTLSNLDKLVELPGFTIKSAEKFIDSLIVNNNINANEKLLQNKLRGQILYPSLTEETRKKTEVVVAVHLTINSVSWSCINQSNYELSEWGYYNLQVPDGKKLLMSDLYNMAWQIFTRIPQSDMYVMEAPVTMLRATGSDPQNPKVLTINLQKAQVTAMLVALLNSAKVLEDRYPEVCEQRVYFIRQSLPARLFRNLVGNERVSAENTVTEILSNSSSKDNSEVFVPQRLIDFYNSKKDLDKETLGQCLLLALTFMDLCFYRNSKSMEKLLNK